MRVGHCWEIATQIAGKALIGKKHKEAEERER